MSCKESGNTRYLILGIMAVIATVYFLDQSTPAIKNKKKLGTVVVFGDSLVRGKGVKPDQSYSKQLEKLLGINIINLGKNGDTSTSALQRIDQILSENPDTVIVTLGGNDLLQRIGLKATLENLESLFKQLQQNQIMVFYTGIEPPLVGDNWAMAIKQLCLQMGVGYIPRVMEDLWGNPEKMSDRIHPNRAGYLLFAQRVYAALEPFK